MKYQALKPDLFRLNRKRFARQMEANSIAIFNSNDLMPRSGDQFFPFRQNAGLFYLCGIDQPTSVLLLFPDCKRDGYQTLLFIEKTTEHMAVWDGALLTKEEASAISGIKKVFWLEELEAVLPELVHQADHIYINTNENDRFNSPVPSRDLRFARQLQERYPAHSYRRAQPILRKLMMIKSKWELDPLQRAIDITESAFRRVLAHLRPGLMEYEVEAEIIHEFVRQRATGHAYPPIIGSGKNACVLHYIKNNSRCQDGEILLMDFGAEYANYAADLTRSVPVNGQFSARQRAVYEAVHQVLKQATELLVPGTLLEEYHKEVGKMMTSALLDLKLLSKKEVSQQDPDRPAYKKYFMHGTSHHLGLDVHDLSDRYVPVQAGMVFTVEPGIYIPEENLGIRLENDVLVTDQGPINLMANIPIEAGEIEELMNVQVLS